MKERNGGPAAKAWPIRTAACDELIRRVAQLAGFDPPVDAGRVAAGVRLAPRASVRGGELCGLGSGQRRVDSGELEVSEPRRAAQPEDQHVDGDPDGEAGEADENVHGCRSGGASLPKAYQTTPCRINGRQTWVVTCWSPLIT